MRISEMSVNLDGLPPSVEVKGELSLLDPLSRNSALEFCIYKVFHCDGLLLCISQCYRIVVWNPLTGQTRWIESGGVLSRKFALGYYQDEKSNTRSYKVLSYFNVYDDRNSKIYDFETDSWRILDGDSVGRPACKGDEQMVSFKGNSCWFANEENPELDVYLLTFDFATDKFGRVPLPYKPRYYGRLSVVREEKLCVLLQQNFWSKSEIWVTSKICETNKGVSWSKVLEFDLRPHNLELPLAFLFDEEKKVVICCDRWFDENDDGYGKDMVYIVGEDNNVTQKEFGLGEYYSCLPAVLNYFPSLVQIERAGGKKRKRLDT
ncbi:unnamed protein product [Microthlaspi erraticum]|uniref:F-box associated beta-propeller type 1 domain-containing protein n=1 Tax=Microthlaspi erraticum TaxID=1685480 RepID=A0A6D2KVJ6_9BRAS|nr:unnamed protein product [Microthlaspi erraticum]